MEGDRVDEYLITIVLNKCFSQTYPLDILTALFASPLSHCLKGKLMAKVFGLDSNKSNWILPLLPLLLCCCWFCLFPPLSPQKALICKLESLLQSYYLLWRWFEMQVMVVARALNLAQLSWASLHESLRRRCQGRRRRRREAANKQIKVLTSNLHSPSVPQLCPVMAQRVHLNVKQNWAPTQTAFIPAVCSQSPSFRNSRTNREKKISNLSWAEIPSTCWSTDQGGNMKWALRGKQKEDDPPHNNHHQNHLWSASLPLPRHHTSQTDFTHLLLLRLSEAGHCC